MFVIIRIGHAMVGSSIMSYDVLPHIHLGINMPAKSLSLTTTTLRSSIAPFCIWIHLRM